MNKSKNLYRPCLSAKLQCVWKSLYVIDFSNKHCPAPRGYGWLWQLHRTCLSSSHAKQKRDPTEMCLFHGIPTNYAPLFCNMSFERDILLISCNLVLFCRGLPWKIHSQKQPIAVIAERRLQYGNHTVKVRYKLAANNVVEINAKVLHRKQTCPLKIYGWKMY